MIFTKRMYKIAAGMLFSAYFFSLHASTPWFTGPLLASAGQTLPKGQSNLEFFNFNKLYQGVYNADWSFHHSEQFQIYQLYTQYYYGLSEHVDLGIAVPYDWVDTNLSNRNYWEDMTLFLDYQLNRQDTSTWPLDIKLSLNQTFPVGRYDNLNPNGQGRDATGLGSYQTGITVYFQHLQEINFTHFLRTRLNINVTHPSKTAIHGISVYGGTPQTKGVITPGNFFSADLASELTLNQHWVLVGELYINYITPTTFRGHSGLTGLNSPMIIGGENVQISLAPAVEYNFSAKIGVIAGIWFTVAGKNTLGFITPSVAINMLF